MVKHFKKILASEALPDIKEHSIIFHNGKGYYYFCKTYSPNLGKREFICVEQTCKVTARMGTASGAPLIDTGPHNHPEDLAYREKCILLHNIRQRFLQESTPISLVLQEALLSCLSLVENEENSPASYDSEAISNRETIHLHKEDTIAVNSDDVVLSETNEDSLVVMPTEDDVRYTKSRTCKTPQTTDEKTKTTSGMTSKKRKRVREMGSNEVAQNDLDKEELCMPCRLSEPENIEFIDVSIQKCEPEDGIQSISDDEDETVNNELKRKHEIAVRDDLITTRIVSKTNEDSLVVMPTENYVRYAKSKNCKRPQTTGEKTKTTSRMTSKKRKRVIEMGNIGVAQNDLDKEELCMPSRLSEPENIEFIEVDIQKCEPEDGVQSILDDEDETVNNEPKRKHEIAVRDDLITPSIMEDETVNDELKRADKIEMSDDLMTSSLMEAETVLRSNERKRKQQIVVRDDLMDSSLEDKTDNNELKRNLQITVRDDLTTPSLMEDETVVNEVREKQQIAVRGDLMTPSLNVEPISHPTFSSQPWEKHFPVKMDKKVKCVCCRLYSKDRSTLYVCSICKDHGKKPYGLCMPECFTQWHK